MVKDIGDKLGHYIKAYSLKNALEFGKADVGKVLPKLFQHGLDKSKIGEVMPTIQKLVLEINKMKPQERVIEFENFEKFVKVKEEENKDLPELSNVKGKVVMRIAPFPSGAIHLGNARTFLLNDLYAKKYKGNLILVIDDTIGSVKKPIDPESYKMIEEDLKWLDVKYGKKIYYKSDRVKIYYGYAEKLIRKGKAYVCRCIQGEMQKNRKLGKECSCREYPPEIQMKRWKKMFKLPEGEGVLRIKTNMQHEDPGFRDRVLFKISDRVHSRVKKKYRVWPALEMSWAIDDHLLKMTHILRGNDLRMETKMEKYIWDIFGWKHPEIIHNGLVRVGGIEGAKIGKSKSQAEVKSGKFSGWDDPRTWSIRSLKRRGIEPKSIREFVKEIGVTKQDVEVPIETLYSINRKMIDGEAERYSFVVNPIELTIKNPLKILHAKIPIHPNKKEFREVKVGKIFYVCGDDFKELRGKEIRLLHLYNIKMKKNSEITSIENKEIPKINWVSVGVSGRVNMPDGSWIEGLVEKSIKDLKVGETIQLERFGFVNFLGKNKDSYEFSFGHR
jgi:glutamyl-tRNA synthetase